MAFNLSRAVPEDPAQDNPALQQPEASSGFDVSRAVVESAVAPEPAPPQQRAFPTLSERPGDVETLARIQQREAAPLTREGGALDPIAAPLTSVAGGITGLVGGGVGGILSEAASGFDTPPIGDVIESVTGATQFTPDTRRGQEGLETFGKVAEGVGDVANVVIAENLRGVIWAFTGFDAKLTQQIIDDIKANGISAVLGDSTLESTDSPLAATAAFMFPELVATVLGGATSQIGRSVVSGTAAAARATGEAIQDTGQRLSSAFRSQSAEKQNRARALEGELVDDAGAKIDPSDPEFVSPSDASRAGFTIEGKTVDSQGKPIGRVVREPKALAAMKQGLSKPVTATVQSMSADTKTRALRQLKIARRASTDPKFSNESRPGDIAGEALMERFKIINGANKKAGKELNAVARRLKGDVDTSGAVQTFLDDIKELNVTVDDDFVPQFKASALDASPGSRQAIKKAMDWIKRNDMSNPAVLHQTKKFLRELVTFNKGNPARGLTASSERVIKKLASNIDGILDAKFPEYDRVNTILAETIPALDAFKAVAGKKMDFEGADINSAVGTLLRSVMSQAQRRVPLKDAMKEIDRLAIKYATTKNPAPTDNMNDLILFADELTEIFKIAPRTGFGGQIGQAVQGVADVAVAAATGDPTAIGTTALRRFTKKGKGDDIDVDKAFAAIRDLLRAP